MTKIIAQTIAITALLFTGIGAGADPSIKEQWIENQDKILALLADNGLGADRCTLQAKTIFCKSAPKKVTAYDRRYSPSWDFSDGTLRGISEHSSGLAALQNKDGVLGFDVTKPNSYFGWGNINLTEPEINLGSDPVNQGLRGRRLYGFRVRIKQTLPESVWKVAVRAKLMKNPSELHYSEPVTVKGTDWQTVFIKAPKLGLTYRKHFAYFSGVRLITETQGNTVAIENVVPCVYESRPFFRKDVELASKVRWAKVSIVGDTRFSIYVNGVLAVESPPARLRYDPTFDYELPAKAFTPGKNTVVVETYKNNLIFDGAILCENGDHVRIDSDDSWIAANGDLDPNDLKPDAEVKDWAPCTLRQGTPCTFPYNGKWHVYEGRETKADWKLSMKNPSWKGIISATPVGRKQPVYGKDEEVRIRVAVPRRKGETHEVSWKLFDEMGDYYHAADKLIAEGDLPLDPRPSPARRSPGEGGTLDDMGLISFKAGVLPHNHAYALVLSLSTNGDVVETYRYELAVCGPVEQPVITKQDSYTDGMKLKLVYEIDAAAEPAEGEFVSCTPDEGNKHGIREVPSTVIETPLGKFRQTYTGGNSGGDCGMGNSYISWKYRLENPSRPHIVIAEYPDDTMRCQSMLVTDAAPDSENIDWGNSYFLNKQAGNDTVMLGLENPLTHTLKQHHVLLFPQGKLGTISIFSIGFGLGNWSAGRPARVGKIRIYEVLSDIPRLKINDAPGSRRWIGQRLEPGPRAVWQSCFSSPISSIVRTYAILKNTPNFYRNWMVTTINLIKRMRFAGENAIGYGVYMYRGVLYPSKYSYNTALEYNYCSGTLRDSMVLMAKMFEENDLGIFASLELVSFPDLNISKSNEQVAQGADTPIQVDKHGKQLGGRLGASPNWTHPEAMERLNAVVDELTTLYGEHKAFKGLIFYAGPGAVPWGPAWATTEKEPFLSGYGDHTIHRFENDTGVDVPVDDTDPQRFNRRYTWLMKNALPQWSQWRQDRLTATYQEIARRLKTVRKDLQVVCQVLSPKWLDPPETPEQGKGPLDYIRPMGIDVQKLKQQDGITFAKYVRANNTIISTLIGRSDRSWRAKAHSPDHTTVFADDGKSAITVGYGWAEAQNRGPEGWPMMYSKVEAWPFPGGEFASDYYMNVFLRTNPTMMWFGIVDMALWNGREPSMARFAAAYRSLPNGIYRRLHGNGLDRNLWVQVCRYGNDLYGYAANAQYWDLDATLDFAPGLSKTDLLISEPVDGNTWTFRLAPYQMKTFRIADCRDPGVLKRATTSVSPAGQKYLAARLAEFGKQVEQHVEALRQGERLDQAETLLKRCNAMVAEQDFDGAAEALTTSLLWDSLFNLSWTPETEPKQTVIKKADGRVDLSGDPAAWGGAPLFTLDKLSDVRVSKSPWAGPRDYSITAYARWDKDCLYLGYRVYDDDHMPKFNTADCVEMYIDAQLAKDLGHGAYNEDDFNLKLIPPASAADKAQVFLYHGTRTGRKLKDDVEGIEVVGEKLADGFRIAVAVPWSKLGVTPEPGLTIGCDLATFDGDKGKYKNTLMWSAPGNQLFISPRVMGRATLE